MDPVIATRFRYIRNLVRAHAPDIAGHVDNDIAVIEKRLAVVAPAAPSKLPQPPDVPKGHRTDVLQDWAKAWLTAAGLDWTKGGIAAAARSLANDHEWRCLCASMLFGGPQDNALGALADWSVTTTYWSMQDDENSLLYHVGGMLEGKELPGVDTFDPGFQVDAWAREHGIVG